MRKNLSKKITLGILVGTMLMSSSVALAGHVVDFEEKEFHSTAVGTESIAVGYGADAYGNNSIAIGASSSGTAGARGENSIAIGADAYVGGVSYIANDGLNGVAIGTMAKVHGTNNVAIGFGSYVGNETNVVSVGSGGGLQGDYPEYRRIINVADGIGEHDAVTVGQLNEALANVSGGNVDLSDYAKTADVNTSLAAKANASEVYTKDEADARFMKVETIGGNNVIEDSFVIDTNSDNIIKFDTTGITVGENSTHMDEDGFYACDGGTHDYDGANAAMMKDGRIKGAGGAFTVDASGNVTAANLYTKTDVDTKLNEKADADSVYTKAEADSMLDNKADKATTLEGYGITDAYTKNDVDSMIGGSSAAVDGLNQRLDRTNGRLDKVGAGAAALAALHPLDYDAENKLSFAAGMGNYAGATAAAVGAFYRPNEDIMFSLGGTAGNGENMVNLGVSFAVGKGSSGMAKLSKADLVQVVNDMKIENSELRHEINNAKADNQKLQERITKLEELVMKMAGQ